VLFPWSLHESVFSLDDDQGVNVLLQRFPVEYVETNESTAWDDIDRPDDYERLQALDRPQP
jgi:CTP:molybdopterin cytidylyltransferase MocA